MREIDLKNKVRVSESDNGDRVELTKRESKRPRLQSVNKIPYHYAITLLKTFLM